MLQRYANMWSGCYSKNSNRVSSPGLDYKDITFSQQWTEQSISSNPKSDSCSEEPLKVLSTIPVTTSTYPFTTVRQLTIYNLLKDHSTSPFSWNIVICPLIDHQYRKQHITTWIACLDTCIFISKNADKVCNWHLVFTWHITPMSCTMAWGTYEWDDFLLRTSRPLVILWMPLTSIVAISLLFEMISTSWVLG